MNYFWVKCIALVVVLTLSTYYVTIREIFSTSPSLKYDVNNNSNLDIQYHASEDQIREQENHKMNVMFVKGANGRPVGINMESTQTFPTYYTPGSYPHGSAAYVPTYEDAILLPLAKKIRP